MALCPFLQPVNDVVPESGCCVPCCSCVGLLVCTRCSKLSASSGRRLLAYGCKSPDAMTTCNRLSAMHSHLVHMALSAFAAAGGPGVEWCQLCYYVTSGECATGGISHAPPVAVGCWQVVAGSRDATTTCRYLSATHSDLVHMALSAIAAASQRMVCWVDFGAWCGSVCV
jgi:hypothetical protein